MKSTAVIFVLLAIAAVVFVPFTVIWAVNTLFAPLLTIPYNFYTWLSVLILYGFFNGKVAYEKK